MGSNPAFSAFEIIADVRTAGREAVVRMFLFSDTLARTRE